MNAADLPNTRAQLYSTDVTPTSDGTAPTPDDDTYGPDDPQPDEEGGSE